MVKEKKINDVKIIQPYYTIIIDNYKLRKKERERCNTNFMNSKIDLSNEQVINELSFFWKLIE
jgi:hypothetical protein